MSEGTVGGQAAPHDATTIPEWIEAMSVAYGDAPCVVSEVDSMSYHELAAQSAIVARGLLARGVGKGARIGLLFGNGTEWVRWWAATARIGALCVPISTFLKPAELERVVRHADLHGLVACRHFLGRDFEQVVRDAFPQLDDLRFDTALALDAAPYLRWIVMDGGNGPWARDSAWIEEAGADGKWSTILARAEREVHTDDEALCIYTSGQSSEPKGVVHVQGAVVAKAHYLRDMYGFDRATVTDVTMPFFWVGGLTMALFPTLDAGGITRCTDRSTWGVGAVIGSTNMTANSLEVFRKVPSLGMTETLGIYAWGEVFRVDEYPVAAPLDELQPGFDLLLVDAAGHPLPEGAVGEILVRGPSVARRLHKVGRAEVFDRDGFYRTGDRGIRHGSRVHFVGRAQDMIKTSGANVSPAEVERELLTLDGVVAAHVVALDDEVRDQIVAAALVLEEGRSLTVGDVRDALSERLSTYKVPRVVVFLDSIDDVPTTPSMKVRKPELAALIDRVRQEEK